jgi:hypothetical protein
MSGGTAATRMGPAHAAIASRPSGTNAGVFDGAGPGDLVDVIGAGDQVVVIVRPVAEGGGPADPIANPTTFRGGKAIEIVHYRTPRRRSQRSAARSQLDLTAGRA